MQKRGPIIGLAGVILTIASFLVVLSIFPDSELMIDDEMLLSNFLEGMFDQVSDEILIFPGDYNSFIYSSSSSDIPLLWGVQITDFQEGDKFSVSISNIFGDDFGTLQQEGPFLFDMFVIPKSDDYNFQVQNTGNRPINVVMMFAEDPDNSDALTDPNSPLMSTLIPLAVSGIVMIIGIIVIIAGAIITIVDWKKTKNQSRYY